MVNYLKQTVRNTISKLKILEKPSIAYCSQNKLLPAILVNTSSQNVREFLSLMPCEHEAQLNQDIFALLMNGFKPGFFIEIGANDGITFSNTICLEECFGWRGLLIEANPKYFSSLSRREKSTIILKAIYSSKTKIPFVDAGLYGSINKMLDGNNRKVTEENSIIDVDCEPLVDILDRCNAPHHIDFISIDVEGMEYLIVKQMTDSQYRVKCGCVEHNYDDDKYRLISNTLKSANYRIIWEGYTMQDLFFIDAELYPWISTP